MNNIKWMRSQPDSGSAYWRGFLKSSSLTNGAGVFLIYTPLDAHVTGLPYGLRCKLPGMNNEQRASKTLEEAQALAEGALKHWLKKSGLCFSKAGEETAKKVEEKS